MMAVAVVVPAMIVTAIEKSAMINRNSGIATTKISLIVVAITTLVLMSVVIAALVVIDIEVVDAMETSSKRDNSI